MLQLGKKPLSMFPLLEVGLLDFFVFSLVNYAFDVSPIFVLKSS